MSLLSVKNLCTGYGGVDVIKNISFAVGHGCLMGILGGNGSGKTTLLKSICGILPHKGSCTLDAMELEQMSARQIARHCGYIPQRSGISIDVSALDVVLMGFNPQLGLLERPDAAMGEAARQMLARVGLGGREEVNYLTLSEGQKQLCILARTLVADGRLLLLDEPESALDFRFRHRMLTMIKQWVKEERRAAVVALHDPMLALNFCDELFLLRDGEIVDSICPGKDSLEMMERKLEKIYGAVSLVICKDRTGNEHLTMLKVQEDEAWSV